MILLYQLNIAWMREPFTSPLWDTFKAQLERTHAAAHKYDGYVGRYEGEQSKAGYIAPYPENSLIMGNMSWWSSIKDLLDFTFHDETHKTVMKSRRDWFYKPFCTPYNVLYLGDESLINDLEEAKERLMHLQYFGPTWRAFTYQEARRMLNG